MQPRRRDRRQEERAGRIAEWLATIYLTLTGHRILARRWRGHAGEIDLVARRRGLLLFCEVKYRRDSANSGVPTARSGAAVAL